ncbi:MAG: M4 family metallopeptidase [Legionellaceae bacterium]|nr:M4 family metallopeptidase [Legionellaceae bacterium]
MVFYVSNPLAVRLLYTTLIFIATLSANATQPIPLKHMSFSNLQKKVDIIYKEQAQARKTSQNSLRYIKKRTDNKQVHHIRLQQEYLGFPVFGGHAILHKKSSKVIAMNGVIYESLAEDLGDYPPFSTKHERDTLAKFTSKFSEQDIQQKEINQIIYIDEQNHALWAYKISVLIDNNNSIPSKPTVILDANTGVELESFDDIKTSRELIKGIGFGGNQKIGRYQFGNKIAKLDLSRDEYTGICYMENSDVRVVDMNFQYRGPNTPMAFTCPYSPIDNAYWTGYNEDGYDLTNGAYSPSNDALYIGGLIKKMYRKEYGVEALEDRRAPRQLIMRVHYGRGYANAFWDGWQMSFGDGDMMLHPLVSLSIGAHEVSHGFTEHNSNLAYYGHSGGMNESFSDMAAQAAEYYVNKKNTWSIGSEILKGSKQTQAIRFMDRPSRDGRSIDYATHYRKGMDVHYSSGVYNRLFYLLANLPMWNTQKAFEVMLKANMDYWTPKSTFEEGACGVIYATEDLEFSVSDVKKVLEEVMIDYDLC